MNSDKFKNPINNPFTHYWIENFFTDEQYQKIIDIKNNSEFNAVGDSCRASVSLGHSDYLDQVPENFIINDKTKSILTDVFWPSISYQYPKATKEDVIKIDTCNILCIIQKYKEKYTGNCFWWKAFHKNCCQNWK